MTPTERKLLEACAEAIKRLSRHLERGLPAGFGISLGNLQYYAELLKAEQSEGEQT